MFRHALCGYRQLRWKSPRQNFSFHLSEIHFFKNCGAHFTCSKGCFLKRFGTHAGISLYSQNKNKQYMYKCGKYRRISRMTYQPKCVGKITHFETLTLCISLNSSQMCTHFCKDLVTGYFCLYLVKDFISNHHLSSNYTSFHYSAHSTVVIHST